ncbi:MAG: ATPase, T2SS/T4P/T4SS family, partial [Phormidium sp.]
PPDLLRQYKKQQSFELKVFFGVEFFDPEIMDVPVNQVRELIDTLIPIDICRRYRLVPLSKSYGQPPSVLITMVNPDDVEALDDLYRILRPQGLSLQRMVITKEDYEDLITKYLDEQAAIVEKQTNEKKFNLDGIIEGLDIDDLEAVTEETQDLGAGEEESAPIINLVNKILIKALQEGASDIHIEPQEESLRVRFRKDGVLQQAFDPLPKQIIPAVTARFKVISDLDIGECQQAQHGWIRRMFNGRKIDFQVRTVLTSYGEKIVVELQTPEQKADFLPYGLMRMGTADNREKRGKLAIAQPQELYLEILHQQKVVVNFNILEVVQEAVYSAQECLSFPLPPGGINVRQVAASFDYSYSADGRIDIPSDGQFHSVALTSKTTDVDVRYIVVPREDTNVFRIAQLRNPLSAPLLSGPADVYVDGEYILSTNIVTVPPKGQMELGLGVEQAIKVARNTSYSEVRSGETIVAFNELQHQIKIEIANCLSRNAKIEVRERLPIPQEGAKVEVKIEQVSPEWEQYKQEERGTPIQGGYRWQIEVPAKEQKTLSVDYKIKTFVDSELIGGNRRE